MATPGDDPDDPLVQASAMKLQETAESLHEALGGSIDSICRIEPCRKEHAVGYRCRCTLQVVSEPDSPRVLRWAVRQQGRPVVIDDFDIANERIRRAMCDLLASLNTISPDSPLRNSLTSVSFATSWQADRTCLVTLYYDAPLSADDDERGDTWTREALSLATRHGWQQLTARSKKRIRYAFPNRPLTVKDSVYLRRGSDCWEVSLNSETLSNGVDTVKEVVYTKPEGAFAHPNPTVMCQALAWLLNRLEQIVGTTPTPTTSQTTLLELYCGCGAHTMALAKSGLLARIVAVELDDRLVQACYQNAQDNGCDNVIDIVSQDAGQWAQKKANGMCGNDDDASILLVDPPKQGLDDRVKSLALAREGPLLIQHVLYISCGREALVRDLQVLRQEFDVVDCLLLDLFPQTYSVESLVYLRRRKDTGHTD
jgi:23S rRNA (uracil1939-C5)-methyltransferase